MAVSQTHPVGTIHGRSWLRLLAKTKTNKRWSNCVDFTASHPCCSLGKHFNVNPVCSATSKQPNQTPFMLAIPVNRLETCYSRSRQQQQQHRVLFLVNKELITPLNVWKTLFLYLNSEDFTEPSNTDVSDPHTRSCNTRLYYLIV